MPEARRRAPPLLALWAILAAACTGPPPPAPAPADLDVQVAVPYALRTLDPHAENIYGPFEVLSNVYEPLVALDSQLRARPALATSWESPDPTTWVFHLRAGVRFHHGSLLTADDVVYSLERLLHDPRLEMRSRLLQVTEAAALDERTVRVRTSRPTVLLLNQLAFVAIVPLGATGEQLRAGADGTGPFALESWATGAIALRRHQGYWGPRPAPLHLVFHTEVPPAEALGGALDGRFTLVALNARTADADVAAAKGLQVVRTQNLFVRYLGLDVAREMSPFVRAARNPLRDPRARRALALAIDRRQLVAALGTDAVPARQLVPRSVFGFNAALPEPATSLDAARALLREAGFPGGFGATLHTRARFDTAARSLQAQLAPLGVHLEVRLVPDSEFFTALARREYSLWLSGYGCPIGDASELLEEAIHSPDPGRGYGLSNWSGLADPDLDQAIEESGATQDVAARRAAIERLMARVTEAAVWIPLYFDQDAFAVSPRLAWSPRLDGYIRGTDLGPRPENR